MREQKQKDLESHIDALQKETLAITKGEGDDNWSFGDVDQVFDTLEYQQKLDDNLSYHAIIWVLKALMLTILMAEVYPEICQNNALMCHVLDKGSSENPENTKCWNFIWYCKFMYQAVICHTSLLLAIMTVMMSKQEIFILNDAIGILVLSVLNQMGSKLLLEDFKVEFNQIFTDGDFLMIDVKYKCYKPIFTVMQMFRPMFFCMVVVLLATWPMLFEYLATWSMLEFRLFVFCFWIPMFLFTEVIVITRGQRIAATIGSFMDYFKSTEESESEDPSSFS